MRRPNNNLAPLIDLANLHDDGVSWFVKKHPKFVRPDQVISVRNALREIWRGGERANGIVRTILLLDKWVPIEDEQFGPGKMRLLPISVDWQRGTFSYNSLYQIQEALYALLRNSDRAKICARPACPAPYFIAWNRKPRRYCGTECRDAAKRENDLKWWKDHGQDWRKKRKQQSKRRKRRLQR